MFVSVDGVRPGGRSPREGREGLRPAAAIGRPRRRSSVLSSVRLELPLGDRGGRVEGMLLLLLLLASSLAGGEVVGEGQGHPVALAR